MIQYLIQVVAFQLLFLLSYDLFLKKETFFNWNRVYLICSSLISFLLPFIKIESFQNAVPQEYIILLPEIVLTPEIAVETIAPSWNWYLIIGIVVSSLLFLYKIVQLVRLKLKGIIVHRGSYKIIKVPNSTLAFSIFNYVFIGEAIEEEKLEDILSHELVHIREKHSLDLLYFELLRILCWFNPLVYIYQKRISELHEYIADAAIIQNKNKSDYYEKLLAEVFQTQQFSFTNQFFKHSLIKKRIIMLTKQKSREILKLKYLVLVPMLILSLLYTSCGDTSITEIDNNVEAFEKLQQAIDDLNAYSKSLSGVEMMTKEQYQKMQELMRTVYRNESNAIVEEGGESYELPTTNQSYEEYVAARKKSMTETNNFEEVESEAVAFTVIDKAPVFPGCESLGTLEELKRCFTEKVQRHVNHNFNTKLAEETGLVGINKIFVKFIVDKNGEISEILARAPHPTLKEETERVIKSLPKLIPGEKDGKKVSLKYMLPITFKINPKE